MTETNAPDWLIRDTSNVIRGPYTHHEVLQLIKRGQIKGKVEVCRSSTYWFALEETDELEKFFPEITEAPVHQPRREATATLTNAMVAGGDLEEATLISTPMPEPVMNILEEPVEEEPVPAEPEVAEDLVRPALPEDSLDETEEQTKDLVAEPQKRKPKWRFIVVGVSAVVIVALVLILGRDTEKAAPAPGLPVHTAQPKELPPPKLATPKLVLRAYLMRESDELHKAIAQLEKEGGDTGPIAIAQGIHRKSFLFDIEGAIGALESGKSKAMGGNNMVVDNLLGVFLAERDLTRSMAHLEIALKNGGGAVSAYNLAIVSLRAGKLEKAEAMLKALSKSVQPGHALYPDFAVAFAWFADLNGKSALSILNRAIAKDGLDPRLHLMKGLTGLRANQVSGGEKDFRAFVELLPELDPGAAKDVRKIGDEGLYEYVWKRVQEMHGLTTSKNMRLSPVIVAGTGVLTSIQNRNEEAVKILNNALASSPGDPVLLKALGYVRWREGRFQEVQDLFETLPDAAKEDFSVLYLQGRAEFRLGDKAKAEAALAKVVKRVPRRADAWSAYGEVLLSTGKKEEARDAFTTALGIDPLDVTAVRGLDQMRDFSYLDAKAYKELFPVF